jgi:hypothetical protein
MQRCIVLCKSNDVSDDQIRSNLMVKSKAWEPERVNYSVLYDSARNFTQLQWPPDLPQPADDKN